MTHFLLLFRLRRNQSFSGIGIELDSILCWRPAVSCKLQPRYLYGGRNLRQLPTVSAAATSSSGIFHPMIGSSSEIMYLLRNLGRSCRYVTDFGPRDIEFERDLENQLPAWELSCTSVESFKHHGLVKLYPICGRPGDTLALSRVEINQGQTFPNLETGNIIRQYALETVRNLTQIR